MNFVKVQTGFSELKDDDLGTNVKNIINSLTGNENFPHPIPSLSLLNIAYENYISALAEAKDGNVLNASLKQISRNELERTFASLALYVQQVSGDDLNVLLSSGFEPIKVEEEELAVV